MKNENPFNYLILNEESVSFREKIEKYTYNWRWFVVGLMLAIIGSFFYLKYTSKHYLITSSILIDGLEEGGLPSELSAFEDLGIVASSKKSIENEIGILKSRNLMNRVIKKLGIHISYFKKNGLKKIELYKNEVPFKINFFEKDSILEKTDSYFIIDIISDTNFIFKEKDNKKGAEYLFGETIATNFGNILITPNNLNELNKNIDYIVKISPLKKISENYREELKVALLDAKSSIIQLSLKNPIPLKAQDILNNLVELYNKDAVEDKSSISKNTNKFINERLAVIEEELSNAEKSIVNFKTSNRITDVNSQASFASGSSAQIQKRILEIQTQLKLADYVSSYLEANTTQLIPANLGLTDGTVNLNTENYNKLLLERNRILNGSSTKNPVIINIDSQLNQLRTSILQSLVNLKSTLNISLDDALEQESKVSSRITNVPKQENEYRNIQRHQKIVETLYLYLSQKREENAISLAVTVPNSKIIDAADGSTIPVFPKPIFIYFGAAIVGLIVPFMLLFFLFLLDNKVHTLKDVESIIKLPILGDIPNNNTNIKVVTENNQDSISESFRMLRTNITFMLSAIKGRAKTIFVTSTIENEGKSFISSNLAAVLALSNKKVLFIGADLRKPRVGDYYNLEIEKGLTHYLVDDDLKISDIIFHSNEFNVDIIATTQVPPNPSEIITNGKFEKLMEYAKKKYDFIVVDTAPVKIVTDTFLIGEYADLFLYVIRANYLDKRLLDIPKLLSKENRLPNMALVLNDHDVKKGYGYGYGYGEVITKKYWWTNILNKMKQFFIFLWKFVKRIVKRTFKFIFEYILILKEKIYKSIRKR
jgi:tyrosine-protein kinase Etk/Wzc